MITRQVNSSKAQPRRRLRRATRTRSPKGVPSRQMSSYRKFSTNVMHDSLWTHGRPNRLGKGVYFYIIGYNVCSQQKTSTIPAPFLVLCSSLGLSNLSTAGMCVCVCVMKRRRKETEGAGRDEEKTKQTSAYTPPYPLFQIESRRSYSYSRSAFS